MIATNFTKNNPATEGCDCQYELIKSEKRKKEKNKNVFGRKGDTNLLIEQERNTVIKIFAMGQSFLICVFPIISLYLGLNYSFGLIFVTHTSKLGHSYLADMYLLTFLKIQFSSHELHCLSFSLNSSFFF